MSAAEFLAAATASPRDGSATLPQLVGVAKLARRLAVDEPTLRAWARRGKIPSFKLGKLTMFDEADVVAWLASKKSRP
jgi:excisionase family DNA binding protein